MRQIKLRRLIYRLHNSALVYRLQENLKTLNPTSPIVIYQMGKVGSQTLYRTLKEARLPNSIFHVHFLSHKNITKVKKHISTLPDENVHHHFITSQVLRRQLDRSNFQKLWFIITLVRDPIARKISEFFETMWMFSPELIRKNGDVDKEGALEILQKQFHNFDETADRANTWFDEELKTVFGIDVYAYPFNQDTGHVTLENKNVRVLVLRLENFQSNLSLLANFLGADQELQLVKTNVAAQKKSAGAYKYVLQNIALPEAVCERIYTSRYARHFYSDRMRAQFIKQWTGKNLRESQGY